MDNIGSEIGQNQDIIPHATTLEKENHLSSAIICEHSDKGEVSILNHKCLNAGYTFKVMEGTDGTWKTFAATKDQYPKDLNSYLMGKDLPHMLSVMSG